MLKRFIDDCCGQDLVEYTLLVAVVALVSVAAVQQFGNAINNVWTSVSSNLAGGT
jgi:Flp pilus assembly pilin Flp